MEARHEIIVSDDELLRSVANKVRDKCDELARWLAADRKEVVPSDEASDAAIGADDSMTVSGEGVRQELPGLAPAELATMALERSEEAVNAAYVLLGERAEESAKRAVVLAHEARQAVAYSDALLSCSPLVIADHMPVVKQRLHQLLAEVEARLAVTPVSVEPSTFSLVERQGEPRKALMMAASASSAPASARAWNSSAKPDTYGGCSSTKADVGAGSQAGSHGADDDPANMAAVSLRCALCLEDPADEPLLLACLHGSCCRRCAGFASSAQDEAVPSGIECIECRHVTATTSLRSSSLAVALARTSPVVTDDGKTRYPACHMCLGLYRLTAARILCADCGIFMCQSCRYRHDKFSNVSHKVETAYATVESRRKAIEMVASVVIFCPEDAEKYEVYCRTCDRLRCRKCVRSCIEAMHSVMSDLGKLEETQLAMIVRAKIESLGDRLQSRAKLLAEQTRASANGLRAGRACEADLEYLRSGERRLALSLAGRTALPAVVARQQLRELVRHAIHYSRSLLAFTKATGAVTCYLPGQDADVLRCVRQLLDEVLPRASVSSVALGEETRLSTLLHVGGWEDDVACYQQEIGFVRRDAVDDILSDPQPSAIAAETDSLTEADDVIEAGASIASSGTVYSCSTGTVSLSAGATAVCGQSTSIDLPSNEPVSAQDWPSSSFDNGTSHANAALLQRIGQTALIAACGQSTSVNQASSEPVSAQDWPSSSFESRTSAALLQRIGSAARIDGLHLAALSLSELDSDDQLSTASCGSLPTPLTVNTPENYKTEIDDETHNSCQRQQLFAHLERRFFEQPGNLQLLMPEPNQEQQTQLNQQQQTNQEQQPQLNQAQQRRPYQDRQQQQRYQEQLHLNLREQHLNLQQQNLNLQQQYLNLQQQCLNQEKQQLSLRQQQLEKQQQPNPQHMLTLMLMALLQQQSGQQKQK